ncbi:hypothetical protein QBC34DRAFT_102779 [Podospora aff. communis PSN243]|uniref:Uncharacterized protein n=1 Tax=Podospora aff. communis PSN243 TaxID=3040156 RepID=A0AAV9GN88_9PEZI|nr:hypothetical protein QBC34DRAFT_102779 [Podospora aff. communis PSN243]
MRFKGRKQVMAFSRLRRTGCVQAQCSSSCRSGSACCPKIEAIDEWGRFWRIITTSTLGRSFLHRSRSTNVCLTAGPASALGRLEPVNRLRDLSLRVSPARLPDRELPKNPFPQKRNLRQGLLESGDGGVPFSEQSIVLNRCSLCWAEEVQAQPGQSASASNNSNSHSSHIPLPRSSLYLMTTPLPASRVASRCAPKTQGPGNISTPDVTHEERVLRSTATIG